MQLDLCVLQNVHSDLTSARGNDAPGSRAADRVQNPSDTGAREKDFRSTLGRAESYREADSRRTDGSDKPIEPAGNRFRDRANDKSYRNIQSDHESNDCRHSRESSPAKEASVEDDTTIPADQNKPDAVVPDISNGAGAKVIASQLLVEMVPGMSTQPEPEGTTGGPTGDAINPTRPLLGAAESGSVVSAAFDGEKTGTATTSTLAAIDDPAGVNSNTTGKPSGDPAEPAVAVESAAAATDHPENDVLDRPLSEIQRTLSKIDLPSKAAENAPETAAAKTLAEEQAMTERQTSDKVKKVGPTLPVVENSRAGEGPHQKSATNERLGQFEHDRVDRLAVESERRPRSESTPAAQNDTRGNQDVSGASTPKTGVDVDQSVKLNDLVPTSQRPAVGEGNAPVGADHLESRPSAPKADVLNQIVDRAVFKLNSGQAEVRIDLKPDFLGHVRLQIVTENHQVNLRILAESHAVKDLIDGNLGQLKNDLQAQGLKVDEIDVSVAKDFNDYDRRPNFAAHDGHGRQRSAFKGQSGLENEMADGSRLPTRLNTRAGGIDCFA